MKTVLLILLVTLTAASSVSAWAEEVPKPNSHKTALKRTSHTAVCNTAAGKHKKECGQR